MVVVIHHSRGRDPTWLGWLVERERPLVFIVDATQDRDELVRQCLAIGYERLAGELVGGVAAWVERGLRVATVALVGPSETLGTMLGGSSPICSTSVPRCWRWRC